MTVEATGWDYFALIFTDVKCYPTMTDVALKLGISYQTVRNKSVILRKMALSDSTLPSIINRSGARSVTKDDGTPEEHAQARAVLLSKEITDLVTGTLRWQGQLDCVIEHFSKRPLAKLDFEVVQILRLAAYQLLHLARVPAAAAVNDAVAMTRRARQASNPITTSAARLPHARSCQNEETTG